VEGRVQLLPSREEALDLSEKLTGNSFNERCKSRILTTLTSSEPFHVASDYPDVVKRNILARHFKVNYRLM
jgi:uncharacterized protein YciW